MEELNLLELCKQGGWIMIVLAILSIITFYIFIDRFIAIRSAERDDPLFMERIREFVKAGDVQAAINYCRVTDTPSSRIVERGVSRMHLPAPEIQAAIENTGNLEVAQLEKRIYLLATISGGAPMIGFLGTVIGMVQAFWNMSNAGGSLDISTLSGGIYQAMITTVGGLIVGIIALFAYNYLVAKVAGVVNELERRSLTFMDIMNEED